MKTISRYLMTLALLLTAATGAWAQTQWTSGDCTVTLSNGTLTVSGKGAMADLVSEQQPWDNYKNDITSVVVESGVTAIGTGVFDNFKNMTSVTLPEGLTSIGNHAFYSCSSLTSITIPSTVTSIGIDTFWGCEGMTDVYLYADPANLTWAEDACDDFKYFPQGSTQCHVLAEHLSAYETKFTGVVNVTFVGDLKPLADGPEVTTNAAEEGATFTEASFLMPTYDVNFNYELVRDMSVQMQAQVGDDATKEPRYRVQWNEEKDTFEPAEMDYQQVLELFSVYDGIEGTTVAPKNYRVSIYAVDDEGNPTGDAMNFTNFTFAPGRYCVTASAQLDAPYDGTTAPSNIFELFQGYQVVIPAGEYVTYYKDEALYVEDQDAKLYTITTVGNETATATELTVAAANTPLLVKNNAAEAKTILLIPTTSATPDEVTPYEGFKGTLEATQIAASTATQNNYALNGKEFVWVMEAIDIAANRAWLEVPAATASGRALQIVFSDVTGMSEELRVKSEEFATAQWYDLNGRKLQAAPTKKGIYIMNGRKVVVK